MRPVDDPRWGAALDLLRRTGTSAVGFRYTETEPGTDEPTMWMAWARWGERCEAAGALFPLTALTRLCTLAVDGGTCAHCGRPSALADDSCAPAGAVGAMICWYRFDASAERYRRGCEAPETL